MMLYTFGSGSLTASYDPEALTLNVSCKDKTWHWADKPHLVLGRGEVLSFDDTEKESHEYHTGIADGVRASYKDFHRADGTVLHYTVYTDVSVDRMKNDLHMTVRVAGADIFAVGKVIFPPRFAYDAKEGEGYTILPRMQGTLVPAGHPIKIQSGIIYERDAYIPVFGQEKLGAGWMMIVETPFDAKYTMEGEEIQPYFIPSLGRVDQNRTVRFRFYEKDFDWNVLGRDYRAYLAERGELVTLKEKIARNPKAEYLIGTLIVHSGIAVHISPASHYYDPEHPEKNDYYTPFSVRAEQLRKLKEHGAEKVYLHLDGWGNHGYDNLHPDVFPPHEASGGADGMRELQRTCTELGYQFGIHDQYHDYYYDAESFSLDNAVMNSDGSHFHSSYWYGGDHTFLCPVLAPDYVRRNYDEFEKLDIHLDGSYLDVFSVVPMDECFDPSHPASREQCAVKRRECLDILSSRGIIPSSEEVLGCIVSSQVLCHHAPFFTDPLGGPDCRPVGIPIPLLNLVYHDCVVIPWFGINYCGGWSIPKEDWGYLWALLCGDTVYISIEEDPETVKFSKIALELNRRVAFCTLDRHEIIDGDPRRRRSTFSDGTVVEADFDKKAFSIRYPDGEEVRFADENHEIN